MGEIRGMKKAVFLVLLLVVCCFISISCAEKTIELSDLPWGITPNEAIERLKNKYGENNVDFYVFVSPYNSKVIPTITPHKNFWGEVPDYVVSAYDYNLKEL